MPDRNELKCPTSAFDICGQAKCAWYDVVNQHCAVLTIACALSAQETKPVKHKKEGHKMAVNVSKVPVKEVNNYPQGKSGSKVKIVNGPAVGSTSGNPGQPLGGKK